jgi:hypothetical protein
MNIVKVRASGAPVTAVKCSFLYNPLEQIPHRSVMWRGWQQAGKTSD